MKSKLNFKKTIFFSVLPVVSLRTVGFTKNCSNNEVRFFFLKKKNCHHSLLHLISFIETVYLLSAQKNILSFESCYLISCKLP